MLCTNSCHQQLPSSQPHLQLLQSSHPFRETSLSIRHWWQAEDLGKRSVALTQIQDLLQKTTESISKAADISRYAHQKKGRKSQTRERRKQKELDPAEGTPRSAEEEKLHSGAACCSPWRTMPDQMDMPDETAASGEPALEQRKTMRKKQQQQRGTPVC